MKISIIIPAYNEEHFIRPTLQTVKKRALHPGDLEIIVVDGGSNDRTIANAKQEGVRVIKASQKRRSIQMNEGAQAASGEMLYFLHADTKPPLHFDRHIVQSYHQGYSTGCFQLSFDSDSRLLAFYSWCTRFDINVFRFGDQSIFVHKQIYDSTGGFRDDYHLMEGHEFMGRLKRRVPFLIGRPRVTTSARKYKANGPLRLQVIYAVIFMLSKCGLEQSTLRILYRRWVQ